MKMFLNHEKHHNYMNSTDFWFSNVLVDWLTYIVTPIKHFIYFQIGFICVFWFEENAKKEMEYHIISHDLCTVCRILFWWLRCSRPCYQCICQTRQTPQCVQYHKVPQWWLWNCLWHIWGLLYSLRMWFFRSTSMINICRSQNFTLGGAASGNCASGFGVCCLFTGTCGGTSSFNNTYFKVIIGPIVSR